MAEILVGTCGWADQTLLRSGFYPREAKTAKARLEHYSRLFRVVEVDSSFYAMPSEATTGNWVEWTPKTFVFDVKAFRLFTHHSTPLASLPRDIRDTLPDRISGRPSLYYRDLPPDVLADLWGRFERALLPLDSGGKLGTVLFQFPPWFLPGASSLRYLSELKSRLPQYLPAVEFRSSAWFPEGQGSEILSFLRAQGLPFVCVDGPQGFKSSVPPLVEATAGVALVRLHGRNRETWEKEGVGAAERFNYSYQVEELLEWAPRVARLSGISEQVHVLFNNCYGDKAVVNARQFSAITGNLETDCQGGNKQYEESGPQGGNIDCRERRDKGITLQPGTSDKPC